MLLRGGQVSGGDDAIMAQLDRPLAFTFDEGGGKERVSTGFASGQEEDGGGEVWLS